MPIAIPLRSAFVDAHAADTRRLRRWDPMVERRARIGGAGLASAGSSALSLRAMVGFATIR